MYTREVLESQMQEFVKKNKKKLRGILATFLLFALFYNVAAFKNKKCRQTQTQNS